MNKHRIYFKTVRQLGGRGFIATTALILIALGSIASVMVIFTASMSYADSVTRREYRIQKLFNQKACKDTRDLILAKDYFFDGLAYLPEFDCSIER